MQRETEELEAREFEPVPGGRARNGSQDLSSSMSQWASELGLEKELASVERRMRELVDSSQKILTEVALHVVDSGGKRLRPSLAILAHKSLKGEDLGNVIDISAAIELIHSATLIHDDINDGAEMRRGRKAAYREFGLHEAIVAGDFMFARAFCVGGRFDADIVDLVAESCKSLAEGEIMQYRNRNNANLSVEDYMKIIGGKTAHPIKTSAQVGASLAGGDHDQIRAFGNYGMNIGTAFQIVDDILDIVGEEKSLGKRTGSDIREGNMTLPVILALERDPEISKALPGILGNRDMGVGQTTEFLEKIRESGGVDAAYEVSYEFAEAAVSYLDYIPDSVFRNKLSELPRLIVGRSV